MRNLPERLSNDPWYIRPFLWSQRRKYGVHLKSASIAGAAPAQSIPFVQILTNAGGMAAAGAAWRDTGEIAMARRKTLAIAIAALLAMAVVPARADEQAIRRVVTTKVPDAKIVSVQKLPYSGLYEVAIQRAEGGFAILYADGAAQVLFVGRLIDTTTDRDLTEERVAGLSRIDWSALPFKWAITMKRGDGRRGIAIFSDPNCPFCKKLEADLATLDDITIHIFPYPVIKPESVRQTKAVWCSRDRVKAWNDLMHHRIEPAAKPDCETPIERLVELGRKLGATSTPTWFLPNGEKRAGAMKLEDLVPLLDATARRK